MVFNILSPTCFVRIVDKKLKGVLLLNSYYFSFLLQLILRLNKNLQTVKLKYILITLFLRRTFSRPFIYYYYFASEGFHGL